MGRVQADDFIAGWFGGAASVIVGHPLDTVKARLQAGHGYGNTCNCILKVYKNENVAGFFKGMSFPLASIAVYNSVVFGVFSNTQRLIRRYRNTSQTRSPDLIDLTVASMLAGCVSVGIGGPVDLVKIKLQMQTLSATSEGLPRNQGATLTHDKTRYRGPIHCVNCILRKEGFSGMYRGAGAMLLRDVPGYCLYFIPYTYICEWMTFSHHTTPSAFSVWLAGGIAGAISWGTATPMDVVKTRLQADSLCPRKYKGVRDCISQSYRNEGIQTTTKCPCNESSAVTHKHFSGDACSCLLIPEEGNCNLTCFQDGIDKYKGIITKGHPGKFINKTFSTYAAMCALTSCAGECRNMTTVNATVFWNEVQKAFQQITSANQNIKAKGHLVAV
ncbi:solute carrier family 25 member 48 [Pseudophryne corroboree]|uniref:solute carrier family 25 member 48 n=1 Tax=Pseudophryne corroboree TaxID=495146 RepID=UPI003081DB1E